MTRFNRYRTTDVFFIGYPKTGNTWVRFLVGRYLQNLCKQKNIPLFDGYNIWGVCQRACIGPSMYFTHDPLVWTKQTAANLTFHNTVKPYLGKKIVLITRYPLDALVSSWFQDRYQIDPPYEHDLYTYLEDSVRGLDKCLRFHNLWAEHRMLFADFHLLEYESLRVDTLLQFENLIRFLELPLDPEHVQDAVEFSSFENMKKIEATHTEPQYQSSGLPVFAAGDKKNPDAFHVRRGKIGGYKDYLDSAAVAHYGESIHRNLDPFFGYTQAQLPG